MTFDPAHAPTDSLAAVVDAAVADRRLLAHPFYRRWEAGELSMSELSEYTVHYRAFEAVLPELLAGVVGELLEAGQTDAAAMVERNLQDELGRPEPHLALFDRFAAVLPATHATVPGPAAVALVDTYRELAAESPIAALAGLAAYETQAAEVAETKADGLRNRYGVDDSGVRFWDVHAAMDADHGAWAVEVLEALGAGAGVVADAAGRAATAWWSFLDERESEGMLAA